MTVTPIARERRHTLYFLEEIRAASPVFIDTEVDMTAVVGHRADARRDGRRYSVVSYLLHTAGRVLAAHPEANAAIQGRLRPKVVRFPSVDGKLALDKTVNGRRVVLAAVLRDLGAASLDDVQAQVDHYRDGDPSTMAEFAGVRAVHRMPAAAGRTAFRLGVRPLRRRQLMLGTFALTSLGHRAVDSFHSVGGTTVTLGVGRIMDRPVVRDGQVVIAPMMRLSLAFDHRVIDGAEAADVLTELKTGLETWSANPPAASEAVPATMAAGAAMNDLTELKQYIEVHARALDITGYAAVLDRIRTDDDGGDGSWVTEWSRTAEKLERAGDLLAACRHYVIARFPAVNGPARQVALERSIAAFDHWRTTRSIDRLDIDLPGGRVVCWTTGLSGTERRPVLLVLGGIVSTKEQWGPVLLQAQRLGMAGIVTEMPGVGENTLRYDADSWRMLPALLDAVADRADTSKTYAMALSFAGHLALRAAASDSRIRGIMTAGAPVREFFTDQAWQEGLPKVTVDTVAHLAGIKPEGLADHVRDWALTDEELSRVKIPVRYVVSLRDEIIPGGEAELLRARLADFDTIENDDVHGSPAHLPQSRVWLALSLLRMLDGRRLQRAIFSTIWAALRARGKRQRR